MLIDVNNLGFAAASGPVLKVGDVQTQAVYGVLRSLRMMAQRFPQFTPVVLWDGQTWRKDAFADYKANRDKPAKSKHDEKLLEIRREYRKQKPLIDKALSHLGVLQINTANLEADDLAAMFCRASKDERRIILLSGDRDWVQLITPKISWLNPVGKPLLITPRKIKEVLGVESARAWLDVKAIQGDVSDNVPGVGGIGEKGAIELVNTFGSVNGFFNQVIVEKSVDYKKLPKKFRDLIDLQEKQEIYHRNLMLMDLNHQAVPKPIDLVQTKGRFDAEAFGALCRELLFKSMLTDLDGWMAPFDPNYQPLEEAA